MEIRLTDYDTSKRDISLKNKDFANFKLEQVMNKFMDAPNKSDFLDFSREEIFIGLSLALIVFVFAPIAMSDMLFQAIGILDFYVYIGLLSLIGWASVYLPVRENNREFAILRVFSLVLVSVVMASGYVSYTILQNDFLIDSDAYLGPVIFLTAVLIGAIAGYISSRIIQE